MSLITLANTSDVSRHQFCLDLANQSRSTKAFKAREEQHLAAQVRQSTNIDVMLVLTHVLIPLSWGA